MKKLLHKLNNMKYRHKLTALLVAASLVPMMVLILYSHSRTSVLIRERETEGMSSVLEQIRESIDSQISIFSSLLNYLTYSPEIQDLIGDHDMDSYTAYRKFTENADPLLSVPKSYHDAIVQIQLFADSIPVRHDYTLVPLKEMQKEWWFSALQDDVKAQWLVNPEKKEIAAVRRLYEGYEETAALCITLDYEKMFQPFANAVTDKIGGVILDGQGNVLFRLKEPEDERLAVVDAGKDIPAEVYKNYACVESMSREVGWQFFLYKPQSEIAAAVSQLLMGEIPLLVLCVVIVLFIGSLFSRLFTRRIEALTANMERVNQGSREVTVHSDSDDEIGHLIRSFQRMMEETDRLIHEVYENRIARKEFELKALQAQINPHFLYNSLSIINWMAIRSRQMDISKVTLALSTFYRTALSRGEDMVTLEACIRNIEAYLEIQLVMHDHEFRVEWEIDQKVKGEKIPKLLLQPVVENALEHGLDEKEEGEKVLKLFFVQDGSDVLLAVEDNGNGMEQEKADALVTYQAKGYGLKNVNDRICLLYGDEYAIRIFSRLGEGTRVEMRIPKGD